MAEGKRVQDWNPWSLHLAMTANINRDPKKTSPASPEHFHPYMRKTRRRSGGDAISAAISAAKSNRFIRRH